MEHKEKNYKSCHKTDFITVYILYDQNTLLKGVNLVRETVTHTAYSERVRQTW